MLFNSFLHSFGYLTRSIAAVSPAVIVPSLFRIRQKGYGVAKGIPTLIIAVSGIDDAVSVAGFGIIMSIMLGDGGEWNGTKIYAFLSINSFMLIN